MNQLPKKLILLLLVLSPLLAGCLASQNPQISYITTEVGFLSFNTLSAKSSFTVKNPNPIPLRGKLEYELFIKQEKILAGDSSPIDMPANGESTFNLESEIELTKVFGLVSTMIKEIEAGQSTLPFQINGKFKTDIAGIPIEVPVRVSGEFPLPKLPQLDFVNASLSSISFDSTELKLRVRLKNENNFPIKIDPFPYVLRSDNREIASGQLDKSVKLDANQATDVVVNLKVNFAQLGETLLENLKSEKFNGDIKGNYNLIQ
jgi:LEA14-like dessication related protein